MAHLLHIDSSPRGEQFPSEALRGSHSRRITRAFVEHWKADHSDHVTYRNVGQNPVPHVDEPWIAAAFTPPAQHTPEM